MSFWRFRHTTPPQVIYRNERTFTIPQNKASLPSRIVANGRLCKGGPEIAAVRTRTHLGRLPSCANAAQLYSGTGKEWRCGQSADPDGVPPPSKCVQMGRRTIADTPADPSVPASYVLYKQPSTTKIGSFITCRLLDNHGSGRSNADQIVFVLWCV